MSLIEIMKDLEFIPYIPPSSSHIGNSGLFYVSFELARRGFHVGVTIGNVPNVDLVVAIERTKKQICLQVKTSSNAYRERKKKNPLKWYEWDVSKKAASLESGNLFYAFVDLKGNHYNKTITPDVYIVPSTKIKECFDEMKKEGINITRYMFWFTEEESKEYKNKWDVFE